jgi:hypothetical protein
MVIVCILIGALVFAAGYGLGFVRGLKAGGAWSLD